MTKIMASGDCLFRTPTSSTWSDLNLFLDLGSDPDPVIISESEVDLDSKPKLFGNIFYVPLQNSLIS
jgi:hypothetical protein